MYSPKTNRDDQQLSFVTAQGEARLDFRDACQPADHTIALRWCMTPQLMDYGVILVPSLAE